MPAYSTILHKRNSNFDAVPSTDSLSAGEIAINTADGKLFTKTLNNVVQTFLNSSQLSYMLNASLSSSNYQYGTNTVTGILAGILGGVNNNVSGAGSVVVNGSDNDIDADYAFVGNGSSNTILTGGDFGAILGGQNNTLNHEESFIIGSNITSHLSGFTYVNNLSSVGKIYGDGSELTGIVAGDMEATTLVRSNSGFWQETYTFVQAESGSWATGGQPQTLSFNEGTNNLTISPGGNTISLSALAQPTGYIINSDFSEPYNYIGRAEQGTVVGDSSWFITRLQITSSGTVTKATATGSWTNRTSLSYT